MACVDFGNSAIAFTTVNTCSVEWRSSGFVLMWNQLQNYDLHNCVQVFLYLCGHIGLGDVEPAGPGFGLVWFHNA
jgi:hypothetical protein